MEKNMDNEMDLNLFSSFSGLAAQAGHEGHQEAGRLSGGCVNFDPATAALPQRNFPLGLGAPWRLTYAMSF